MRTARLAVAGSVLGIVVGSACADFIGIQWEEDAFGLDHVTPLASLEGYAGQRVINVYAAFDDPDDQCVGVVGSPDHPFNVATVGGTGFVNASPQNHSAPLFILAEVFPDVHFDCFMAVGLFTSGAGSPDGPGNLVDQMIIAAGSDPPDEDPWGDGGDINLAWTVPPTQDGGTPTPQSVAGNFPGNRVLIFRLAVQPEEDVFGEMGLLILTDEHPSGAEIGASFMTTPAGIAVDDDAPNDPGPGDPFISDPLEDGSAEHPFDTIQEAIDAAPGGGVHVVVAPGFYPEAIEMAGSGLVVRSAEGPDVTTIDATGLGTRVVTINGPRGDPELRGFTITGGSSPEGGGVFIAPGTAATLEACRITGNAATTGGGLYTDGAPTISDCTFDANEATGDGGGVFVLGGQPTFSHCRFTGNVAGGHGGGLSASVSATPDFVNCLLAANAAGLTGGGAHLNLIVGVPTLINCTIRGNSASGGGGGIASSVFLGEPILRNSIVWGNGEPPFAGDVPAATYCCIQGGLPGLGNIDSDPAFVGPDDARLFPGSPCIDAASNNAVPAGVTTDLDGAPRFVDDFATQDTGAGDFPPIVDIGAYEFQSLCQFDITFDGIVDVQDLVEVVLNWGPTGGAADVNGDNAVDVVDLTAVILAWGPCP